MALQVGEIVEGKVRNIMPFGAFVSLPGNKTGLVHISEVATDYIKDINERLKPGDEVKVKILGIEDNGKISLSIKKALPPKEKKPARSAKPTEKQPVRPIEIDWSKPSSSEMSFEDKLSKFKQDSDEKIQALKRSNESKRSGGYHRGGNGYL